MKLKGMFCRRCGSNEAVHNGKTGAGTQRYQCSDCGQRFTAKTALRDPGEATDKAHARVKAQEEAVTLEQLSVEEQLRRENRALNRQIKSLTAEAIDTQQLRLLIHGYKEALIDPPTWVVQRKKASVHGTPSLFLSDLHWAEVVFPQQVGGVNEFNLNVAHRRLKRIFETTVRLCRDHLVGGEYHGFVLPLGGDMISGNIHEEIRENNEIQVLPALLDLLEHMVAGVKLLADEFGRVFIPCVVGNHGRMDRKPRAKGGVRDNFEWLFYHMLAREFAGDKRVHVAVSESFDYLYRIHNTRYLLTHGDQFRGGSGISGPILPWTLGDHRKRKRQDAVGQPYDIMIFGHWHQLFFGSGSFICNGSLKGYDEYAARNNFPPQPAMQALWITHPEKGIHHQLPVYADEKTDLAPTEWVSIPAQ